MKFLPVTNRRSILIFLLFLLCVVSCTDVAKENKSAANSAVKTDEATITSIYNSFLHEKTVCQDFTKAIAEDPEFIRGFEKLDYRERDSGQRLPAMLSKSKVAKNKEVQYVLTHIDYFFVDVDFHGGPGMTYVKDSPIYCMQTDKRLKELEALPLSEQSWKVREHFLNLALDSLLEFGMPGYEGPVYADFDAFNAEVYVAKLRYLNRFRGPLKNWMQKATMRLRERVKDASDESMPKEQQLREIEQWISELKKGLE